MIDLKFFYQPQNRLRKHSNKFLFLGLSVMICLSMLLIWQRIAVIKILKESEGLKEVLAKEEKRYKYLNLELTEVSSIERIEKIAQERLGLVYPNRQQIVYVDLEKINKPTLAGDLWARLKNIGKKINPFSESGVQAKEVKHDL